MVQKQRVLPKLPCKVEAELDKISSLPGHIIDNILSHLPIKDAVKTSVLSRKWRYRWATVPSLVFDTHCFSVSSQDPALIKNKLVSIIDHVLLLHNGPLQKFKLSHRDLLGIADIDRWILFISRSFIKEFILEIWKGQRYRPPSSLFNCQNLIHLELFNCLLKPPESFKGFRNLKSLDLQHITITQDVFENLISSCPLLERLTLMNFDGFMDLNIDAPNLQFFDVGGVFRDVSFKNTFSLALISIGLYVSINDVDDQRKAGENSSKLLRFFANLPHIRRLEIQSYFLKYLASGSIPSSLPEKSLDLNYLSIRINFSDLDETLAVLCLLRSSPNLQELEILARPEEQPSTGTFTNFWADNLWCSLFTNLQVVKVVGISGLKTELDFINFILSNSPVLERMTVKPASLDGSWGLVKELLRFRRASIHAEIIYLDP
ncbi:hypothetical protein SLA2020_310040 [Shorea laevis]